MTDFGNPEERAVALRVALACKELNDAISAAVCLNVNVKVADLSTEWGDHSRLQVQRMERRIMILPTASGAA